LAFLTKSLPRRTVLRGLGATLALPFLDAMLPPFSLSAKTAAKPVHRFQTFYVPNGMAMEYWSPKTEGSDFELTPILEPLATPDAGAVGYQGDKVPLIPNAVHKPIISPISLNPHSLQK
jgi:hypothetical protein